MSIVAQSDQLPRVPVRLVLWSEDGRDYASIRMQADRAPGRNNWEVAQVEELAGVPCPLDIHDLRALDAAANYGWAYAVYYAPQTGSGAAAGRSDGADNTR